METLDETIERKCIEENKILEDSIRQLINQIVTADSIKNLPSTIENSFNFIGDWSTICKIGISIWTKYEAIKFESYLVQFYRTIHQDNKIENFDIKKIEQYLKKNIHVQFIAETIDVSLRSQSIALRF
jgi:hypothetical protein